MKQVGEKTIQWLAERSDQNVMLITTILATLPYWLYLFVLLAWRANGWPVASLQFPSPVWIPLCFITIPPIHYLCRQVRLLKERLDAIEGASQSGDRDVAGGH